MSLITQKDQSSNVEYIYKQYNQVITRNIVLNIIYCIIHSSTNSERISNHTIKKTGHLVVSVGTVIVYLLIARKCKQLSNMGQSMTMHSINKLDKQTDMPSTLQHTCQQLSNALNAVSNSAVKRS